MKCQGCGQTSAGRYCDDCIAEQEAASERRYFDMADYSYVNDLYGYNGDDDNYGVTPDDWE